MTLSNLIAEVEEVMESIDGDNCTTSSSRAFYLFDVLDKAVQSQNSTSPLHDLINRYINHLIQYYS